MKKSMVTLFAFSALMMGTSIYSASTASAPVIPAGSLSTTNGISTDDMMHVLPYHAPDQDGNDGLETSLHKFDSAAQNALMQLRSDFQAALNDWRSHHMDRMHKDQDMIQDMMSKGGLRAIEDAKGNIIGAYKSLGETKGYRYGSFYTNITKAPVSVIEGGRNSGTPVNIAVSGVSTIIGYLDNPDYQGEKSGLAGGPVKQITLYQYTMPAQPVMDHAAPQVASTAVMPAPINVTVQSYNDNDENDNHHKKHHHDNDENDEHHHLISIF